MVIVVHDPDPARAALVCAIAAECGVRSMRLAPSMPLPVRAGHERVICVTVARRAPALDPRTIGEATARGAIVVVIDDGQPPAPLAERCRWLLAGAQGVFDASAPAFADELRSALATIVEHETRRGAEEERLRTLFARFGLVGRSEPMLAVFRRIEKVGRFSELPALILGETGTGKELVARAIHQLDPRRRSCPFVAVNCAAIALGVAESELFGHRRGAFTGADRERRGLVRAAEGGVLFLDEIGDLHLDLQAKLLRVLQERRVLGLGEEREAEVDLRVIAATHRDLRQLVAEGRFREDLYHRLKLLPVELPPLRSHPEDLPLLVEHFIGRSAFPRAEPGRDFLQALASMALRGNVRELENLVRSALIAARPGTALGLADLPPEAWSEIDDAGALVAAPADAEADGLSLSESLARCEKRLVEAAMRQAHNNQARAAALLGITPRSVYNKLRRHQIHL